MGRRSGWLRPALLAVLFGTAGAGRGLAYEADTHYMLTYYLSVQLGFNEIQAYQNASGAFAIDMDKDTGPLEATKSDALIYPVPQMKFIWCGFHAFLDDGCYRSCTAHWVLRGLSKVRSPLVHTSLVDHGQLGMALPEREAREAQAKRKEALRALSLTTRNPGTWLHFMQDTYSHDGYWVKGRQAFAGHGFPNGHAADFLSSDVPKGKRMAAETVEALSFTMRKLLDRQPQADVAVDDIVETIARVNQPPGLGDLNTYNVKCTSGVPVLKSARTAIAKMRNGIAIPWSWYQYDYAPDGTCADPYMALATKVSLSPSADAPRSWIRPDRSRLYVRFPYRIDSNANPAPGTKHQYPGLTVFVRFSLLDASGGAIWTTEAQLAGTPGENLAEFEIQDRLEPGTYTARCAIKGWNLEQVDLPPHTITVEERPRPARPPRPRVWVLKKIERDPDGMSLSANSVRTHREERLVISIGTVEHQLTEWADVAATTLVADYRHHAVFRMPPEELEEDQQYHLAVRSQARGTDMAVRPEPFRMLATWGASGASLTGDRTPVVNGRPQDGVRDDERALGWHTGSDGIPVLVTSMSQGYTLSPDPTERNIELIARINGRVAVRYRYGLEADLPPPALRQAGAPGASPVIEVTIPEEVHAPRAGSFSARLYRSEAGLDGPFTAISTLTGPRYTDSAVSVGRRYHYRYTILEPIPGSPPEETKPSDVASLEVTRSPSQRKMRVRVRVNPDNLKLEEVRVLKDTTLESGSLISYERRITERTEITPEGITWTRQETFSHRSELNFTYSSGIKWSQPPQVIGEGSEFDISMEAWRDPEHARRVSDPPGLAYVAPRSGPGSPGSMLLEVVDKQRFPYTGSERLRKRVVTCKVGAVPQRPAAIVFCGALDTVDPMAGGPTPSWVYLEFVYEPM